MGICKKGIECLECVNRGMCSSYAQFKYRQGYNQGIDDFINRLARADEHIETTWEDIYKMRDRLERGEQSEQSKR